MLVSDFISILSTQPQDLEVKVVVGWSADSAESDDDSELKVDNDDGVIMIRGWLSGCDTELEFED